MNTNKLGMNITKIVAVLHVAMSIVLVTCGVVYRVLCFSSSDILNNAFLNFQSADTAGKVNGSFAQISMYSMQVKIPVSEGIVDPNLFLIFTLGGAAMLMLMGLIFFNLHHIFKSSLEASPFNAENVERVKRVGILAIGITLAGMICGFVMAICGILSGINGVDVVIDIASVLWGVIVLCISRFFVYGAQLEKEVDGLL